MGTRKRDPRGGGGAQRPLRGEGVCTQLLSAGRQGGWGLEEGPPDVSLQHGECAEGLIALWEF